jgi:putative nucleotidyltransferase with HDIG domain
MQSVITHAGEGLAGWVIQNGKPLHINNLAEDPRYVATFDGMNSGLYIPMQTHNQIIGCISVESDQVNAFTEDDEHLLITLATQAAEAMRNAELFETIQKELAQRKLAEKQIQRQLGHLTALSSIDRTIASSLDLKFNLSEILTHVMAELEVDAASILILNSSSHMLEYGVARGFRTKVDRKSQVQLGESYAGQVALKRKLVQIPDLREEPENLLLTSPLKDEGFAFYSGSPLITKQQVKGVFQVFHRTPLEPDAEWLDFFYALAGQAAIAIETVSLFEDLQRSNTELSLAYDATIEGWSRALDLRDKETEGHTLRVTELTLTFARKVGLSEEELVNVRWGALLHDIGKLGVPDGILLKPGALTEEEWVKMRKHPRFAYELLSPILYLRQALDIPYCHHEKWDGSGYPRGLKGDQIPIVARIFAVVDVWDALTSERPYRPAWTKEKTREHIRASSGTHFDPEIVEVFLKLDLETKESSNNEK